MTTLVRCFNEWDPLKRVILGRPDGTNMTAPEPAYWWENDSEPGPRVINCRPIPQERVEAANEQMDAFQATLEQRGIVVDRAVVHPAMLDRRPTMTPDWCVPLQYGANNPRDTHLCIGNEIIEAPMSKRCRWYEYLALRPILERYFKKDPGFLWTAAPKPRLSDDRYDLDYIHDMEHVLTPEEKRERLHRRRFLLEEVEPCFDAADLLRCGKDIFWLASFTTNEVGRDWLKRHLEPKGYRFHLVEVDNWCAPYHIDAILFAPRPGLMYYNPEWIPRNEEFFELLRTNDWELIKNGEPRPEHQDMVRRTGEDEYSTAWKAINGLPLDPHTVCVEATQTELAERLEKKGLEVITVPYDQVAVFGGSLHCSTLDVLREGGCEDYFPKQIPGY
ncbi:MAG: serine/threonine protein kinase [Candidatus Eisenbacteria bacterium]|nr:serine/threonine protein kinase [Candidatus Eisenbacteria bacterium]